MAGLGRPSRPLGMPPLLFRGSSPEGQVVQLRQNLARRMRGVGLNSGVKPANSTARSPYRIPGPPSLRQP